MFFHLAKIALKSLFSKPATRRYPFEVREAYKHTRGQIAIEINQCIYCGICQRKCPTAALAVDRQAKSWTIDRLRCISCRACVGVCPKSCLTMKNSYTKPSLNRRKETFKNA